MKFFVAFLPLLGLVAAQMHEQMMGAARQNYDDPFFNDGFAGTGSKTPPPWAAPPGQAAPGPIGGSNPQSQSSTKPPYHPAAPVGGPQVANNNPHANADPNAGGGNSGGLAGFGETDRFHAVLDANANGGAQPLPGAGGAVGGGNGQSSGEQAAGGGGGGGGDYPIPMGPGLIAGGGFDPNDMQKKADSNEVYSAAASASTVVGVVVAVLIVLGIFALVAVFLVRQRRQSRVVIGSV